MEIDSFKQELYNRVLEVSGLKPSNIESIDHSVDTVYLNLKEGTRIGITVSEEDEHCKESEFDIYNELN